MCHGFWATEPSVLVSCVPGTVKAEMLEMYTQEDLLILCVRLAVLLAVTLTVPVVLFPVSGGKEGLASEGIRGWAEGRTGLVNREGKNRWLDKRGPGVRYVAQFAECFLTYMRPWVRSAALF